MMSIQAHTTDQMPIESASMGRPEYWNWFLASGGTLIDGLSIFSLGVAMPLITSRFSLSALMVYRFSLGSWRRVWCGHRRAGSRSFRS